MNFAFLVALAVICVTSTEGRRCRCSIKYKPISIPHVSYVGGWYTFQRYDNGPQKDTICYIYGIFLNAAVPGSMTIFTTSVFPEGLLRNTKGDLTPTSSTDLASFNVKWADPTQMPITAMTIVSSDKDNYMIVRACYKLEEYVWIWVKQTNPSKKVLDLIEAAIVEQKLDRSKLRTSCVGYGDAHPEPPGVTTTTPKTKSS